MSWLLPLVVFLPLAGAVVLAFLPREEAGAHKLWALATSLVAFGASLVLLSRFEVGVAGFQEALTVDLMWIESLSVRFHMAVDGISLFLLLLTTFLTPIVILSAWNAVSSRTKEFMLALLALETGMLGAFVAVDLVLFYVFWEAMLIPMYLLIGIWGGPRRIYSAVKFFLYTMVGSLLMLLAILYLFFEEGSFDYRVLLDASLPLSTQHWLFWAFVAAFAIKVPMLPVHTWLPDAHVEAPTAGSAILAGVLLKMGSYGLMRFAFPLFPEAATVWAPWLAGASVAAIVYGALMALAQSDVKKLIAYSSVSHMGFVTMGLCAMTVKAGSGAVYQMLNHGVSSGGLFLLVGILYERRHTRLVADFGGIAKVMPVYAAFFLLIVLSSAGLPGTNGFVGEFLILLGTYNAAPLWAQWCAGIGATGVILGAVYLLWMYRRVFFGPLVGRANQALTDLSAREWMVALPLAVVVVWMGVMPQPFLDRITPSVEAYVGRILSRSAVARAGDGTLAAATGELATALGAPPGHVVLVGPGKPILAGPNVELEGALLQARAWNRARSRPQGAPTPRAQGAPTPRLQGAPVPLQVPEARPRIVPNPLRPVRPQAPFPAIDIARRQLEAQIRARREAAAREGEADPEEAPAP